MKRLIWFTILFLTLLFVLSLSCDCDKKNPTGPSNDTDVTITDNTVVVEQEANIEPETITENTITYIVTGQAPEIKTGDILVSGEGTGYLRKVTSTAIDSGKLVVETEQAVLTDAVVEGTIDTTFTLDFSYQNPEKGIGVMKAAKGVAVTKECITINEVELSSKTGDVTNFKVTLTNGSITFNPDFKYKGEFKSSTTQDFRAVVSGELSINFDIDAIANTSIADSGEVNLYTYKDIKLQMIGWVPVVEVIYYELYAGFIVNATGPGSITTGFDHTRTVEIGAEYKSNNWSTIFEIIPETPVFIKHETALEGNASIDVKVYVKPRVSLKFYDTAGPTIDVRPYLGFDGKIGGEYAWYWELSGGINSYLGFNVSLLGKGIFDKEWQLFSKEKLFASDFEELPQTYSITGTILENDTGLPDVTVNIKGAGVDTTTTTDQNGNYTFTGLVASTYQITPSKSGYSFNPASIEGTIIDSDIFVTDITATPSNGGEIDITFVSIPSGTFRMGDIQGGGYSDELPVHNVTLDGFDMSVYEITNSQYAQYLADALSSGDITASSSSVKGASGDWSGQEYLDLDGSYCEIAYSDGSFMVDTGRENYPVIEVSWYGAKAFAAYYGFDLPTEAEWEYACRAGTETKYYTGNTESDLSEAGWYYYNSDTGDYPWTHPGGQKVLNAWGLYDMHGNVWEWCHDWYDSDYYSYSPSSNPTGAQTGSARVRRGGSWGNFAYSCRSAGRGGSGPGYGSDGLGFRVVRR